MKTRHLLFPTALAALIAACSPGTGDDVPPLPEQTAESANALMAEAERAATNAAARAETVGSPARSQATILNEVTP
jgi:hypothetical protein